MTLLNATVEVPNPRLSRPGMRPRRVSPISPTMWSSPFSPGLFASRNSAAATAANSRLSTNVSTRGDESVVNLHHSGPAEADGVDMCFRSYPCSEKHRQRRPGHRADDVRGGSGLAWIVVSTYVRCSLGCHTRIWRVGLRRAWRGLRWRPPRRPQSGIVERTAAMHPS